MNAEQTATQIHLHDSFVDEKGREAVGQVVEVHRVFSTLKLVILGKDHQVHYVCWPAKGVGTKVMQMLLNVGWFGNKNQATRNPLPVGTYATRALLD